MKKVIILLLIIIMASFVGCSSKSTLSTSAVDTSVNLKLVNATGEQASRTLLRSLCENDYDLFLKIANVKDSTENKSRFELIRKGYEKKDYKAIILTENKNLYNCFETEQLDSDGNKMLYEKGKVGEFVAIVKIILKPSDDGKFYFDDWKIYD